MNNLNKPHENKIVCSIREPILNDENKFISAMQRSQVLHHPWVVSPKTSEGFKNYFQRAQQNNQKSFLVLNQTEEITGVFNINEIVRGFFQNAYLGFYAIADYAGQGYMSAGLKLVLQQVLEEMALHRLEANIQPGNTPSTFNWPRKYLNIQCVNYDHGAL